MYQDDKEQYSFHLNLDGILRLTKSVDGCLIADLILIMSSVTITRGTVRDVCSTTPCRSQRGWSPRNTHATVSSQTGFSVDIRKAIVYSSMLPSCLSCPTTFYSNIVILPVGIAQTSLSIQA